MLNEFLEEERADYLNDPRTTIGHRGLPGPAGMKISNRLSESQMLSLTDRYGVEFAQVYRLGEGRNGGGGQYILYSGTANQVTVPLDPKNIVIGHTHPGGSDYPSMADLRLISALSQLGSPQRTSAIYPNGKQTVKFTVKGSRDA
jgi:hypothetical protein